MRSNGGRQRGSGIGWFVGPLSRALEVPDPWEWTPLEWSLQGDWVEKCQGFLRSSTERASVEQ